MSDEWDDDYADRLEVERTIDDRIELPFGWKLTMTCMACPEQYDLTDETGEMAGYFRLRHGYYRVDVPDVGGQTAYSRSFDDGWLGIFPDQETRVTELQRGVDAVVRSRL